jgi:ankyrin repeat protein
MDGPPLHFAAQAGLLQVYQFIDPSYPTNLYNPTTTGVTPLHLAAANGHLNNYRFICTNLA